MLSQKLEDGPAAAAPPVGPVPLRSAGGLVTFGCLNRPVKIGRRIAGIWAQLLAAVPRSRLLLAGGCGREMIGALFEGTGLSPNRVALAAPAPRGAYLARYAQIDIALDPWPYHGTTTICDALWMGVPVVTLAGPTHASRVGVSMLSAVGLMELVATSPADYIRVAAGLANDPEKLRSLRAGLRDRMKQSPLLDGVSLARRIEEAYRRMWTIWCAQNSPIEID